MSKRKVYYDVFEGKYMPVTKEMKEADKRRGLERNGRKCVQPHGPKIPPPGIDIS